MEAVKGRPWIASQGDGLWRFRGPTLFYVLVGATMPSILAQVSFVSNPLEEKLLGKEEYRMTIAQSIATGIKTYLSSASPVQKVAGLKNGPAPKTTKKKTAKTKTYLAKR